MSGIIVGCGLIFAGFMAILCGYEDRFDMTKYVLKSEVIQAFDGKWDSQTFWNGETKLTDKDGNWMFYPQKMVDERINKLNKVLKK